MDVKDRYLWTLQQVLTDQLRIDNPQATALPLGFAGRRQATQRLRDRVVTAILRPMGLVPMQPSPLSVADRRERRANGTDWPPLGETMVGVTRLQHLQMLIDRVLAEGIPGDLLEAGVWRGGASIFMQAMLTVNDATDRQIWVCDSFEGLPPPDPNVPQDAGSKFHLYASLAISEETVRANFERYGLMGKNVRFVKGYFEKTLSSAPVEQLALLRMDGDMYSSSRAILDPLYDKLSPGGFVVIDDYFLGPCREAIEDFCKERGITADITPIDDSSAFWRKPD